ncbi:MAG: radical SAM family heme chaperone HemW [Lentisphaerae bacterium]|nr:radical SAM family heme chaperone HemW [Lentisphaerota bacterium]
MTYENLYIHVPFCRCKCDYCAFYSVTAATPELVTNWLDRIIEQLEQIKQSEKLDTVFIGGGTPTSLDQNQLSRLFSAVSKLTGRDTEITIESNPETVTPEKIALLTEYVTRISMGVQSFNPELREALGRRCSNEAIDHAINLIRSASKFQFNIDLIYAIPGQTIEDWENDLRRVVDSGVNHVSCYSLSMEEGTLLASRIKEASLVDDEMSVKMWNMAGELLGNAGMPRYEISNYADLQYQCRHNRNIWYGGRYLGLGPAASSFDGRNRWTQVPSITEWLKNKTPEMDIITPQLRLNEIFSFGLRTVAGWDRTRWENLYSLKFCPQSWDVIQNRIKHLPVPVKGLFKTNDSQIRLTERGMKFWDLAAEALI